MQPFEKYLFKKIYWAATNIWSRSYSYPPTALPCRIIISVDLATKLQPPIPLAPWGRKATLGNLEASGHQKVPFSVEGLY